MNKKKKRKQKDNFFIRLFKKYGQFIKYCCISQLSSYVYVIFYVIVNFIGRSFEDQTSVYLVANAIAYTASYTVLFFMDRKLFDARPEHASLRLFQMIMFIVARVIGFGIDESLLYFFADTLGFGRWFGKLADSIIMFFYNYLVNTLVVFKIKEQPKSKRKKKKALAI